MSARNSPGLGWNPFGWTRQRLPRRSARTSKNGRAWQRPRESRRNEQDLLAQLVTHAVGAVQTGSRVGDLGGKQRHQRKGERDYALDRSHEIFKRSHLSI